VFLTEPPSIPSAFSCHRLSDTRSAAVIFKIWPPCSMSLTAISPTSCSSPELHSKMRMPLLHSRASPAAHRAAGRAPCLCCPPQPPRCPLRYPSPHTSVVDVFATSPASCRFKPYSNPCFVAREYQIPAMLRQTAPPLLCFLLTAGNPNLPAPLSRRSVDGRPRSRTLSAVQSVHHGPVDQVHKHGPPLVHGRTSRPIRNQRRRSIRPESNRPHTGQLGVFC
jgi:hypothetical protein